VWVPVSFLGQEDGEVICVEDGACPKIDNAVLRSRPRWQIL
jgi:hypothetical protein